MAFITASSSSSLLLPFLSEGICYPISYGKTCNSIKFPIDGRRVLDLTSTRYKSPFIGPPRFPWLSTGYDFLSKICAAAANSDSSDNIRKKGYRPPARLSSAEIAKTTVEANKSALLVFPGKVHSEPHEKISWAEFRYFLDKRRKVIYFEIFDAENILKNPWKDNPVNALIGMDLPMYHNRRIPTENDIFGDELSYDNDDDDIKVPEIVDFETPAHPIYISKCLAKAVNMEDDRRMDFPSNGVSILGYLRPIYTVAADTRLRLVYPYWKDFYSGSFNDQRKITHSIVYRLKIEKITLHSVYGSQSGISLQKFKVAKPDILVTCALEILGHFNRNRFDIQKFCQREGLGAEGALLIGIDRLGMDVRVFSGTEVKTHRFAFKFQALSKSIAEKEVLRLLHPLHWRNECRRLLWYRSGWRREIKPE